MGVPGNELILNQKICLAPKMIEDLKVLQMSSLELTQYIVEQLAENPLLEIEEYESSDNDEPEMDSREDELEHTEVDTDIKAYDFLSVKSQPLTLRQYLYSQLGEYKVSVHYQKIAKYLIECINDDGYVINDINDISKDLRVPITDVMKALKLIQKFDPDGVGARNLRESLIIQLDKMGMLSEELKAAIFYHLRLIADRKYNKAAKKMGISKEKIYEIHEVIKTLNPKPGQAFAEDSDNYYITPELEVREIDGFYHVMFINEKFPKIRITDYYKQLKRSKECDKETKLYIKDRLSKANVIINAIEQRKTTILSVATYIMEYQNEFLKKGYKCLKPMTLKLVAEGLGIHQSTVSRTVNDKYIQTPQGVYELKYFFSSQADTQSTTKMSSNGIKKLMAFMIKNENKTNPLSDDQIRKQLQNEGILIARRTVAKYREELSILPASSRK